MSIIKNVYIVVVAAAAAAAVVILTIHTHRSLSSALQIVSPSLFCCCNFAYNWATYLCAMNARMFYDRNMNVRKARKKNSILLSTLHEIENKYLCCNRVEFDTMKMSECVLHLKCFNCSWYGEYRSETATLWRNDWFLLLLWKIQANEDCTDIDDGRSSIDIGVRHID